MGCGSWSSTDWSAYSKSTISGRTSASSIYTAMSMKKEFDPKNVTRESCDSTDHPNSFPIILGLDVTGSMSGILKVMAEKLGDLMKEIIERKPVEDPQILFGAIGDSVYDDCPLQVTQFESDIRIAKQLTEVYFEKGGGGNNFESYPLLWYFAARHTKCDNYEKRGKKGVLFTFGDDGFPEKLTRNEISEIFGDDIQGDIKVEDILAEVNRKFEIYHFCMAQGGSHRESDLERWQELLGERAIRVKDYQKIPEIIVSILEAMSGKDKDEIISSWDGSTAIAVKEALDGLSITNPTSDLIEF